MQLSGSEPLSDHVATDLPVVCLLLLKLALQIPEDSLTASLHSCTLGERGTYSRLRPATA